MFLFLAKRKICPAILPIFAANLRRYASKSTQNPQSQPTNSMMVDYLVASFGFSSDKALKVSKPIAHLNSPDKPEAVRRFLNQHGFSDAQVKTIITLRPNLLCASPENTLEPNLQSLRDIGLSTSTLTHLILSGPAILHTSSAASRIKFWRDFFQGDDGSLVKAFKQNSNLGTYDIHRRIAPKRLRPRLHVLHLLELESLCSRIQSFAAANKMTNEEFIKKFILPYKEKIAGLLDVYLAACAC